MNPDCCGAGLRPIWAATDYACGRRLAAMLREWIPPSSKINGPTRRSAEKLLMASERTLDRLLNHCA